MSFERHLKTIFGRIMSELSVGSDPELDWSRDIRAQELIPMLRSIHNMKTTVSPSHPEVWNSRVRTADIAFRPTFIDRSLFSRYYMSSDSPVNVCFILSDLFNACHIGSSSMTPLGQLSNHCLRIIFNDNSNKLSLELIEENTQTKANIRTFLAEEPMVSQWIAWIKSYSMPNLCRLLEECGSDQWLHRDWYELWFINTFPIILRQCTVFWQWFQSLPPLTQRVKERSDDKDMQREWRHWMFMKSMDVSNRYRLSLWSYTQALIHTSKLSVRIDADGLLSFIVIKLDQNLIDHCFVEYFIVPEWNNTYISPNHSFNQFIIF